VNRLRDYAYAEAISEAMTLLPAGIRRRVEHTDFLCGVDPLFVGLHGFVKTTDARDYSDTAHCVFRTLGYDKRTTIVLPSVQEPWVIVHELGHALDESLGFDHAAVPVTAYGATHRTEALAEALVAHLYWYGDQDAYMRDLSTRALFASLSE
jgi:hypothetical protein